MTHPDPLENLMKQMTPRIDDSGVWERIEQRVQKRRRSLSSRWLPEPGPGERSGVEKEASAPRRTSGLRVAVYASIVVVLLAAVAIGSVEAVKYLGKGTTIVYITDETTVMSATTTQAVTPTTQATTPTTGGRLGELVWKFQTGGRVRSSPAVSDGVIYFGSEDGYLYAVDIQSGAEKWKFQTGGRVWSSPAVSDGVVYFGSDDTYLYAVDSQTGAEKWKFQTGGPVWSPRPSPTGWSTSAAWTTTSTPWTSRAARRSGSSRPGVRSALPAVSDGVVYFGSMDAYLYAVDSQTGTEKWKFQTGDAAVGSPAISDGVVYFGGVGPGTQVDAYLYAVDIQSGTEKWKFNTGSSFGVKIESSPAISDGVVYFSQLGWLSLRGGHPERPAEVEVPDGRR